jgi:hypothetical protein
MNEITDLLLVLGGIALLAFGIWATCALAGLYLFHKAMKLGKRPPLTAREIIHGPRPARGRRRARP